MSTADSTSGNGPSEVASRTSLDDVFGATSLYALRAAVSAHATELGMGEEQLGRLLIVATELATNAIRHGGGSARLRLWREGEALHCEVTDNGPGISEPDRVGTQPVPLNVDGGRGLWIVRRFTDRLTITSRPSGTVIVAILHV